MGNKPRVTFCLGAELRIGEAQRCVQASDAVIELFIFLQHIRELRAFGPRFRFYCRSLTRVILTLGSLIWGIMSRGWLNVITLFYGLGVLRGFKGFARAARG